MFQAVCNWAKENEDLLDAAAVIPDRYEWVDGFFGSTVKTFFTVISSFFILFIILFLVWYIINWNDSIILTTSPRITLFWFIGFIFIFISIIDTAHGLKYVQSAAIF